MLVSDHQHDALPGYEPDGAGFAMMLPDLVVAQAQVDALEFVSADESLDAYDIVRLDATA